MSAESVCPGSLLFLVSCHFGLWLTLVAKPHIYSSFNSPTKKRLRDSGDGASQNEPHVIRLQQLLTKCPTIHQAYFPPLLFANCHLQLIPFTITSWWHMYRSTFSFERELVTLQDGEVVALDWARDCSGAPNSRSDGGVAGTSSETQPTLIIHHGAFCDSSDVPNQTYIGEALRRGWRVCVLNRRGHGGLKLTKSKWNFFGCASDLRHVVERVVRRRRPRGKVFMIGISAGSGLVARYMGEQGLASVAEGQDTVCEGYVDAAVGVAPGYNIEVCMGRFGPPYSGMLLNKGKQFFLEANRDNLQHLPSFDHCMQAEDFQSWLDHSWSMAGYTSREAYYDGTNPMRVVPYIRQPTLMINASDDPLCNVQNVRDHQHLFDEHELGAAVVLTKTGSHCPFYEVGMGCWAERAAFEFLDAVVAESRTSK